jgi:hypothetical protein
VNRLPVLFAGPTLAGLDEHLVGVSGLELRPPARRGDIEQLVADSNSPRVILLADGIFYQYPSDEF